MASELQLVTVSEAAAQDPRRSADAVAMLDHLESCWSRFLASSDVSRLNLAGGRPVRVDPATITLVSTMIDAWQTTDHRFDPTILPSLMAAGYRSSIEDPRRVTILPSGAMHVGGFDGDRPTIEHVEIDPGTCTVRLPVGLFIDAGGIGKGLAADLSVAHALRSGASGALTSIGGDIAVGGRPPDGGWIVHVEHPDPTRESIGTIAVTGGGVATSSTRSRRWRSGDAERHHVIDPWTDAPSTTDLWAVTVIARSGWLAEAHATAALLAGSAGVVEYLEGHDVSGLAVAADGRLLATMDLAALTSGSATTCGIGAVR